MRSSLRVSKIVVDENIAGIPDIITTTDISVPSASGATMEINSETNLIVGGNVTLARSSNSELATIIGNENGKLNISGTGTFTVTTNVPIEVPYTAESDEQFREILYVEPEDVPEDHIYGSFDVDILNSGDVIPENHIVYTTYKDNSGRTMERLTIKTSVPISISMSSGYSYDSSYSRGAEIIFDTSETTGEPLYVTFDNVTLTQVSIVNGLTVNSETYLTLKGYSKIEIPSYFRWSGFNPATDNYLQILNLENLYLKGSGDLDVFSNQHIDLNNDFSNAVLDAQTRGGNTGNVQVYRMADLNRYSTLTYLNIEKFDTSSTSRNESYITVDDVEVVLTETINSVNYYTLYIKSTNLIKLSNVNINTPLSNYFIEIDLDYGTDVASISEENTGKLADKYALVYFLGLNIGTINGKSGLTINSDTSIRVISGTNSYITETPNVDVRAITSNANVEVISNGGNLHAYVNAGATILGFTGNNTLVGGTSSAGYLYRYIYTSVQDAVDSDYLISRASGASSLPTYQSTLLKDKTEDFYTNSDFILDKTNNTFTITTVNASTFVSTAKNGQTSTDQQLIIDPISTSTATIVFDNVHIIEDTKDYNRPLLLINGNTTITSFTSAVNIIKPMYDPSNLDETASIYINEGSSLTFTKNASSTFTVYTRPNAQSIDGVYSHSGTGSLVLQDILIYSTNGDDLTTADVTFDGDIIIVYSDTPITIKNRNYNTTANYIIRVPSKLSSTVVPNITLAGVNITGTSNSSSAIQLYSSANIYLEGENSISNLVASSYGSIRVGEDSTTGVHVKFYADNDETDIFKIAQRSSSLSAGASIEITKGHTLSIYGGTYYVNSGTMSSGIGSSRYELLDALGDIYIYGGIVDVDSINSTYGIAIGGYNVGGYVNICGGTVKSRTNSVSVGSLTTITGTKLANTSFLLENSGVLLTYVQNSNVSNYTDAHHSVSEITDNSSETQALWNGIRGRVSTNYDTQSASDKEGVFTIYGNNVFSEDYTINKNEKYYFYTDNISVPNKVYLGDENGVRNEDFADINFSNITFSNGARLINNGTIIMPAYCYDNPHLEIDIVQGGVIEIPLNATLIQPITDGSSNQGYRGNTLFDYFIIQQNNQSLVGVVDIDLYYRPTVNSGTWTLVGDGNTDSSKYVIDKAGQYKVEITAKSQYSTSTLDASNIYYTGSATSADFIISATDIAEHGAINVIESSLIYNGESFSEDYIEDQIQVYLDNSGLKLYGQNDKEYATGELPDYYGFFSNAYADYTNVTSDDANLIKYTVDCTSLIESTIATLEGSKEFSFSIEPRTIKDLLVDIKTPNDIVLSGASTKADIEIEFNSSALVEDKDYTLSYDNTTNIGDVEVTVTGMGNFKDEKTISYKLLGDISQAVITDKYNTGSLTVGLAGRANFEDIIVTLNGNTLTYGVDYILSYELDSSTEKITVTVEGIGHYTNSKIQAFDYELEDDTIEMIDPTTIYFKPDNTIADYEIPIAIKTGEEEDGKAIYKTLSLEDDEYSITLEFNEYGDKAIAYVTITVDPTKLDGVDSAIPSKIEKVFELDAVQAGSGTGNDVSKAIIHVVTPVYERPDGVLRVNEDLILKVTDSSSPTGFKTLEKDTDYTIEICDSEIIAGVNSCHVIVTGKTDYTGSVDFYVKTGVAGSGTGTDISQGIIDVVQPIAIPGIANYKDEIPNYIELVVDGVTLQNGVHFEINPDDIDFYEENGIVKSQSGTVKVTALAGITGITKEFEVILVSRTDLLNTDNFYVKPDYSIDVEDIILYDPNYQEKALIKGVDYYSIEPIWSDTDEDGILEFKGITVEYSDEFKENNSITDQYVRFSVSPKNPGSGDSIAYGLINIADAVIQRPDGILYQEDVVLSIHTDKGYFINGEHYEVTYLIEEQGEPHPSLDTDIPTTTHKVHINGLDIYSGSQITFGIISAEAGSGTGTDLANGIIDLAQVVYARPDGSINPNEDLFITVDGNRLVINEDISVTSSYTGSNATGTVTVTALASSSYTGSQTFTYSSADAGSNASGTKDLSNGIIYLSEAVRRDVYGDVKYNELAVVINSGNDVKKTLTANTDYSITYNPTNSTVTVTGLGTETDGYYGEITYKITIIDDVDHSVELNKENITINTVYQRPDAEYYLAEDLEILYNDLVLDYLIDYDFSYDEITQTYTIEALGDYKGTIEGVEIQFSEAGSGTGADVSNGIIHLVESISKEKDDTVDISKLNLYINSNGTKTLFDPAYYDIKLNLNETVTVTGLDPYIGEITFKIEITEYIESNNSNNNSNNNNNNSSTGNNSNTDDELTEDLDEELEEDLEENLDTTIWENPFIDVFETDWFYEEIKYNYIQNIMLGTSTDTFSPYMNATRSMIIQSIYNMESKPYVEIKDIFDDVDNNNWYAEAISWGYLNEVINGTSLTTFEPDRNITRQEIIAMLYRYSENKEISGDFTTFVDYEDISEYAIDAMNWAIGLEIIKGDDLGMINPKKPATRAEIAIILARFSSLNN